VPSNDARVMVETAEARPEDGSCREGDTE